MRERLLALIGVALLLTACGESPTPAHPEEPALKAFLERYFSTWSSRDMEGYGGCFHPSARITFVNQGEGLSQGLTDFLHSQRMSHASASHPMVEVPTNMIISGDDKVAQAEVRWKLTKGAEIVTGTDYFTVIKTRSGWRIISLVFYND
jgi:ketosteroid isomerase-like protein